jgi:hypothetical protein
MGMELTGTRSSMGRWLGGGKRRRSGVVRGLRWSPVMPKGVLQHWGTTRSEEGRSIDDGELGRVELTERARRGGDGSGFVIDGSAPMVGLRREANGDAGGVMHGRFDMERERESEKGARHAATRAPF